LSTFEAGVYPADFKPAVWCAGPHRQTIWPFALRRPPAPEYRRERVELSDGDFIDLDWHDVARQSAAGPLVLLLHGLEGCSRSHYIMGLVHALAAAGYSAVVMQFRTCSGVPNRALRSYHAGETGDLSEVVKHIGRQREIFAAVGFSLGGNVLLKWLGESNTARPVTTAIAISVPYRLDQAAERMQTGASRIYQKRLISLLHAKTRLRLEPRTSPIDLSRLNEWRTFRSFDHNVTAPLHGFDGVDDYYGRSSSLQYLANISLPTLLLHAEDDPFMTPAVIPQEQHLSATTRLEVAEAGGHVGFVSGPWRPRYWLEQRLIGHLHTLL